jgi:hypothetical protein
MSDATNKLVIQAACKKDVIKLLIGFQYKPRNIIFLKQCWHKKPSMV